MNVHDASELLCFAVAAASFTAYLFLTRCAHD